MTEFGIGLLGFGTIGAGVVKGMQRNGDLLAARLGISPVIRKIADIDITSDRGVAVAPDLLSTDAAAVIADPAIDVVVELIGGTDIAKTLIEKALKLGKPVVTANKALLAEHGAELFDLAARNDTDIYFGASVGGGIPIVRALREGLVANRIESIHAILNGTCNYILTRMETDALPFDQALSEAQARGFAEADPALDIDGVDTAHKAVILASWAYGFHLCMDDVSIEGIRGLSERDIRYGRELGYRIKLLAIIKRWANAVEVRIYPTLIPHQQLLASVNGVFNAVMVRGDLTGDTLYYGKGAGQDPTASTVISDVVDVVKNLAMGARRRFPPMNGSSRSISLLASGETESRYYLRLSLLDRPGVLARITDALGRHDISIASVMQKEVNAGDYVPVIILTHRCAEKKCNTALTEIADMDVVGAETIRLRIEE